MLGTKGRQREKRGECRNVNFFCGLFLAVQWERFFPCFFFTTKHGIGHLCTFSLVLYFSIFVFFCGREIVREMKNNYICDLILSFAVKELKLLTT